MRLAVFLALLLVLLPTASGAADAHGAAASPLRVLYASDWNGPMQIFAADPAGRTPVRQLTFDHPVAPCQSPAACGYTRPQPSPDGRWLAYWSTGPDWQPQTLWLAHADGTGARAVGPAMRADWAPDSRRLAYSAEDGIHVLRTSGGDRIVSPREKLLYSVMGDPVRWSPDGKSLAFIRGTASGIALIVRRAGRERVLAPLLATSFAWSPDGAAIAYGTRKAMFLVSTAPGRSRHRQVGGNPCSLSWQLEFAFAPSGRQFAYSCGQRISLLDTRTLRVRTLSAAGHGLAWSPDGRRLLYVQGGESIDGTTIATGDVQTVTPSGHIQTVVAAATPYGGQIVAAAWVTPPRDVSYRPPQALDGFFAGGPVQELAADGARLAFIACGGISTWSSATGSVLDVWQPGGCRATYARGHVYSLALAGDRVFWIEKSWGSCYRWQGHQATLASAPLAVGPEGYGCGGPPLVGMGMAGGSGSLLAVSSWSGRYDEGYLRIDEQTIERLEPGGSLIPLSSTPGPYTLLDVSGDRIVASGMNETRVLDANGKILLSLPVPTLAAQLSESNLVLVAGSELRVYDAASGSLRVTWWLSAQPAGHDCDYFGDPTCLSPPQLRLDDVARGLAAYVLAGQVHLLRLADGADRAVGPGTLARFTDSGLSLADGARIRLVPFERLPLQ